MGTTLFDGAVALVTGAGGGIGRATALLFAQNGARVVCTDIDTQTCEETARLVREDGGETHVIVQDLTQQGAAQAIVASAVAHFGRLDHAFNNAGVVGSHGDLWDEGKFRQTLAVDLEAVIWCMKHEVAHMLVHGGGTIVNTSSIAGLSGSVGSIDYAAAKHGVVGLTKTAAWHHGPQGVRINAVCPGIILTNMTGQGPDDDGTRAAAIARLSPITRGPAEAIDVAEAVIWLSSNKSRFIHGVALPVDGGFMI